MAFNSIIICERPLPGFLLIRRPRLRPRYFPRRLSIMVVSIRGRIASSQLIRRPAEDDDVTFNVYPAYTMFLLQRMEPVLGEPLLRRLDLHVNRLDEAQVDSHEDQDDVKVARPRQVPYVVEETSCMQDCFFYNVWNLSWASHFYVVLIFM
jgi:hypothetical protein